MPKKVFEGESTLSRWTTARVTSEALALCVLVERHVMSAREVVQLCEITPKQAAVATALGLGSLVRRSEAFRRRVLKAFEKLSKENGQ